MNKLILFFEPHSSRLASLKILYYVNIEVILWHFYTLKTLIKLNTFVIFMLLLLLYVQDHVVKGVFLGTVKANGSWNDMPLLQRILHQEMLYQDP